MATYDDFYLRSTFSDGITEARRHSHTGKYFYWVHKLYLSALVDPTGYNKAEVGGEDAKRGE